MKMLYKSFLNNYINQFSLNGVQVKSGQDQSQLELTSLRGQLEKIDNLFRVEKEKYETASETHNHQVAQFKAQIENLNAQIEHIHDETSKTSVNYQVSSSAESFSLLCYKKNSGSNTRKKQELSS